ncbi:MAG TPA: hypothetical protein VE983_05505, partial [Solirubrobacteraceae bacterium]|nr:hypothetical protein [Solirubrobacteraceae bacterium]
RFDELRAVPANGSVIYTATGTVYRIAGGFPFVLTRSLTDHSAGQLIDLWDLHHLSDPRVHLRAVPTSGTVIQAAPSGRFWIFRDDQLLPARRSPGATPVPHIDLSQWRHDCPEPGDGPAAAA